MRLSRTSFLPYYRGILSFTKLQLKSLGNSVDSYMLVEFVFCWVLGLLLFIEDRAWSDVDSVSMSLESIILSKLMDSLWPIVFTMLVTSLITL